MKKLGHSHEAMALVQYQQITATAWVMRPGRRSVWGEQGGGSRARSKGTASVRYGVVSNRDGIICRAAELGLSTERYMVSVDLDANNSEEHPAQFVLRRVRIAGRHRGDQPWI